MPYYAKTMAQATEYATRRGKYAELEEMRNKYDAIVEGSLGLSPLLIVGCTPALVCDARPHIIVVTSIFCVLFISLILDKKSRTCESKMRDLDRECNLSGEG